MSVIHLISDLHLIDSKPHLVALFEKYMDEYAPKSDQLYVLGDLFDVWLGDDAQNELSMKIIDSFRRYSDNQKTLYFCHGNRDFLLGDKFADMTGGQLIGEPHNIEFDGRKICLLHGDSLCTDDIPYQQLRMMVRNPEWQNQFLSKSIPDRIQFAAEVKAKSHNDKEAKSAEIMDVNQQAVVDCIKENGCDILIHGHTHRPDTHLITLDEGREASRIVLSDWDEKGHFLQLSKDGIQSNYF